MLETSNTKSPARAEQKGFDRERGFSGNDTVDLANELWLGGEKGAAIKLEVFSDFQCPRCRDFYLVTLKPLLTEYSRTDKISKIYIVYHDFPLDMHLYAQKAARFALAAASLGRERWLQIIDILYLEQEKWSRDGNIEAALGSALSPSEVAHIGSLAGSPEMEGALLDEIRLGLRRNISSTPTLVISSENGHEERVMGTVSYGVMKSYLDRLLK